jgi:hypothetical protein
MKNEECGINNSGILSANGSATALVENIPVWNLEL